jgi:hypothetical protein
VVAQWIPTFAGMTKAESQDTLPLSRVRSRSDYVETLDEVGGEGKVRQKLFSVGKLASCGLQWIPAFEERRVV